MYAQDTRVFYSEGFFKEIEVSIGLAVLLEDGLHVVLEFLVIGRGGDGG
jgi:hypothetical protein